MAGKWCPKPTTIQVAGATLERQRERERYGAHKGVGGVSLEWPGLYDYRTRQWVYA